MVLADGTGTPLGICVEKASPSAVKLLERTLDRVKVKRRRGARHRPHKPERLTADRGYNSNGARLARHACDRADYPEAAQQHGGDAPGRAETHVLQTTLD
jgi:hypothetical protein